MALEIDQLGAISIEFPVFFPIFGKFNRETGSHATASWAARRLTSAFGIGAFI
jgi:hypothetical protein